MPITAGLVIGGIGAIGKMGVGYSQMNQANEINPVYKAYQKSPYASQYLGAAQNLFNGRMPGAASAEANIRQSQANEMASAQRNATDSSTLLGVGAAGQNQANQGALNLFGQEGQYKASLLPQLGQAYQMNISEGDKEYQDMLHKYQIDLGQKTSLGQAGIGNIFGGVSDIAGGAMQYGNYQNAATANTNASNYNNILRGNFANNMQKPK